jgi:hypothetical protein
MLIRAVGDKAESILDIKAAGRAAKAAARALAEHMTPEFRE